MLRYLHTVPINNAYKNVLVVKTEMCVYCVSDITNINAILSFGPPQARFIISSENSIFEEYSPTLALDLPSPSQVQPTILQFSIIFGGTGHIRSTTLVASVRSGSSEQWILLETEPYRLDLWERCTLGHAHWPMKSRPIKDLEIVCYLLVIITHIFQ